MKFITNTTLAALAMMALTTASFAQTPQYRIYDLGAVNGYSEAFAINNYDQVVGWTFRKDGTYAAAVWRNDKLTLLQPSGPTSCAFAINDNGAIVGKRGTRAVQFTAVNRVRDIGTFGGGEGTALGINESNRVCGSLQDVKSDWKAAGEVYSSQNKAYRKLNLGTLGGLWSSAHDVNNVNVYAGWSHTRSGPSHATMFVENQNPQDLGTLGGPQSEAKSISDYFGVTGWSDTRKVHNAPNNRGRVKHAFLWTPDKKLVDLGDPYTAGKKILKDANGRSYLKMYLCVGEIHQWVNVYGVDTFGFGVNKWENVCGYARMYLGPNPRQVDRAMVDIKGVMYDLNDLAGNPEEWNLDHAWGINDQDVVVGRGFNYRVGSYRAFKAVRIK